MKNLKKKIINGFLLLLVGVSCIPSITVQAKTYMIHLMKNPSILKAIIFKSKRKHKEISTNDCITRNSDGQFAIVSSQALQ